MTRHAIIVGGGISGLAVGRALLESGWTVDIRERTSGLPPTGTALGMWPEAMEALDRLGVGDRARQVGVLQNGASFLRSDGRTITRLGEDQSAYLLTRPALHTLLHDATLDDHITWNAPISDLDELAAADLTVGADGINSVLRGHVAGAAVPPRPLGTVAFRGVVPGGVDTVTETWGPGRLFGITPQDAGSTNWFAGLRTDVLAEHDHGQGDAGVLRSLYGDWHPAIVSVLDRLDATEIDRRTLYDVPPLKSYVRGNIALVGDSAHAMAPNMGRGACESLIDAVALADALRSAASVEEGLRVYDRDRRRATRRFVRASRLLNRVATARRFSRSRNVALRVAARFA